MNVRRQFRWLIAVVSILIGISALIPGALAQSRPRTNQEDLVAWALMGLGSIFIGAGVSFPFAFARPWVVVAIAVASPFAGFGVAVALAWSYIILNSLFRWE